MATISLGKAPKNFKLIVTVPMLDGTSGAVECLFKYRTAQAYGELLDRMSANTAIALQPGEEQSLEAQLRVKNHRNAEFMLEILDAWNLDIGLSRETAIQLCDELPGAAQAIFDRYRVAVVEGRLGN